MNGVAPLGLLVKTWPKLSETFILEEVLGLERRGVPLRLYALQAPTDAITHAAVARVRAPVAWLPALVARAYVGPHLSLALRAPLTYLRTFAAAARRGRVGLASFARAGWLAAQLRADGVAHLHSHFISTPADVAELAARLLAIPFSISAHAKDIYTSRPDDLRRKLRAARFTVTCTEANRAALAAIEPGADVRRMYHGIDAGVFQPRPRAADAAPLLLAVGRLRAKKGLDTLIDACGLLRARGIAFRCEIVGYGEEHATLLARIDEAGLTDRVTLLGKCTREQVIDRYAAASVFVQPSRITADGDRDGIPNVLLEAMAMAVPVVATRVSGIPEVVRHEETGLLVEPDQADQLAAAIARVLAYPREAEQRASAARTIVIDAFDNDRNLQLLLSLLEDRHECSSQCAAA